MSSVIHVTVMLHMDVDVPVPASSCRLQSESSPLKHDKIRVQSSQAAKSTKVLVPLLVFGIILFFGVVALSVLTYTYANKLNSEHKRFVLLDAQYKKVTTELNDTDKSACRACPEGWLHHRGKCYMFSSTMKNWEQSRDHCITIGGHLAIVNAEDEQDFLFAQANGFSLWIGLNDLAVEGEWSWVDNSPLERTGAVFWLNRSHINEESEPDNWKVEDSSGENCASISFQDGDWQDNSCRKIQRFVCEMLAIF